MKGALKTLAATMRPPAAEVAPTTNAGDAPSQRVAATRASTRQLSGHFPAEAVKAFRVLAANHDMDVQELLAEPIDMTFERYGIPDRLEVTSGRRKRF